MFVTFVNLKSFPNKNVFKKYFIGDCGIAVICLKSSSLLRIHYEIFMDKMI